VSIVDADGTTDTTSTVLWLQLESLMVDVRLPADIAGLRDRGGLEACSLEDLRRLTACEASTGRTTCTEVAFDGDGVRRATAEWHTRGPGDIAVHPLTAYPEPGDLEWSDDGSVVVERAPSGAYVEEWHRVPGSEQALAHHELPDGRRLFRAGPVAVIVRDRPVALPRVDRIDVLASETADPAAVARLVDVEFSVAAHGDDGWRITGSTLPWRAGGSIDVDLR